MRLAQRGTTVLYALLGAASFTLGFCSGPWTWY
jgi:hypothetical protein